MGSEMCIRDSRKSWFKDAGLAIPRTWDEFELAAEKLTKFDSKGEKIQVGWGVDNSDGYFGVLVPLGWGAEVELFDKKNLRCNADTEKGRQVMNFFLGLLKKGYTNLGWMDIWQVYTSGKAGMIIADPWFAKLIIKDQGEEGIYEDSAVTYIPTPNGKNFCSMSSGWTMFVAKSSKNKDAAWRFIRWLNDGPEWRFNKFLVERIGCLPSSKDFDSFVGWSKDIKEGYLKCAEVARKAPMLIGIEEIFDTLRTECEKAAFGEQPIENTIEKLARKITGIMLKTEK